MLNKFLETMEKHRMIEKNEGIVIGVSGGPDSVCLLHLFWSIQKEYGLKLYAVHLNHQFRGPEADEDEEYVQNICRSLQIPVFVFSKDVTVYAVEHGLSDEEAGRELRYHCFYEVLKKQDAKKIAVAQNMNDQAETVLMRLMRGAGIEGLSAMEYKRNNTVIRPLLDIERQEIENYCEIHKLFPRIDKTNLQTVYTRNKIRLELIPYMEKYFNKNIKATLCRTAKLLREDSEFINSIANETYHKIVRKTEKGLLISREGLMRQHHAIIKRVLRHGIKNLLGILKNVESKHIDNIIDFMGKGQVGSEINLPNGIVALLDYENLMLLYGPKRRQPQNFEYDVVIGESIHVKELNSIIISRTMDISQAEDIKSSRHKEYFDFGKINKGMIIRNRRSGDRFTPLGMTGTKKLKSFFIDEKVSREERDRIPLICDADEIMWIIGYRVSNKYKIDQDTKTVVELEYKLL